MIKLVRKLTAIITELMDSDEGTTIITTGIVEFTDGSHTDSIKTDDGTLIREPIKEDTDLGSNESHSSEFNEKEDNIAGFKWHNATR